MADKPFQFQTNVPVPGQQHYPVPGNINFVRTTEYNMYPNCIVQPFDDSGYRFIAARNTPAGLEYTIFDHHAFLCLKQSTDCNTPDGFVEFVPEPHGSQEIPVSDIFNAVSYTDYLATVTNDTGTYHASLLNTYVSGRGSPPGMGPIPMINDHGSTEPIVIQQGSGTYEQAMKLLESFQKKGAKIDKLLPKFETYTLGALNRATETKEADEVNKELNLAEQLIEAAKSFENKKIAKAIKEGLTTSLENVQKEFDVVKQACTDMGTIEMVEAVPVEAEPMDQPGIELPQNITTDVQTLPENQLPPIPIPPEVTQGAAIRPEW